MRRTLVLCLMVLFPLAALAGPDKKKKEKDAGTHTAAINFFAGEQLTSPAKTSYTFPVFYSSPALTMHAQKALRGSSLGFSVERRIWKPLYADAELSWAGAHHTFGGANIRQDQFRISTGLRGYLVNHGRFRLYVGGGWASGIVRDRARVTVPSVNTSFRHDSPVFGFSVDAGAKVRLWHGLLAGYQAKYFRLGTPESFYRAIESELFLSETALLLPHHSFEHRITLTYEFGGKR